MTMMKKTLIRKHRTPRQKKTLRNNISVVVLVALLGSGFAILLSSANAMGTHTASDFTRKAAVGNEFEIESSKIALEKSQNDNVRSFAQEMIDDHGKAGDDLVAAMSNANMGSPDTSMDHKHQKMLDQLNATQGTDFDKLYIKDQVKAHDSTVSLFKDYSKHGDNDAIKSFASATLPTLQHHQQKIDQIKASY